MHRPIYIDARCLQDPLYRDGLIGRRLRDLLKARPANLRYIALTGSNAERLQREDAALFDTLTASRNPPCGRLVPIFIDPAPLLYDSWFSLRFMRHPGFITATFVPDFTEPPPQKTITARLLHLANLARLQDFDLFLSPSSGDSWTALENAAEVISPQTTPPRIALLGPADAAQILAAGRSLFDGDLYTGPTVAPIAAKSYNAVVSILSASSPNSSLDLFERFGGPCILHDLRLVDLYHRRLGTEELLRFASVVLNRPIGSEDLKVRFQGMQDSYLLLERIVDRAFPLLVHAKTQQAILKKRYDVDAGVLCCCPSVTFTGDDLTPDRQASARARLGLPGNGFVISAFGPVSALDYRATIYTLEFLRSWGVAAELFFAGDAHDQTSELTYEASAFNISEFVHFGERWTASGAYNDLLLASDVALQLRPYEFGKPSTHVCNCIAAALPTLTTAELAAACDAPSYVQSIPDAYSPLLVAEQLARMCQSPVDRAALLPERAAYLETHNFDYYAARLVELLGLA